MEYAKRLREAESDKGPKYDSVLNIEVLQVVSKYKRLTESNCTRSMTSELFYQ